MVKYSYGFFYSEIILTSYFPCTDFYLEVFEVHCNQEIKLLRDLKRSVFPKLLLIIIQTVQSNSNHSVCVSLLKTVCEQLKCSHQHLKVLLDQLVSSI